jgi:flagellar biosynthesis anti-sigma factor FlgM
LSWDDSAKGLLKERVQHMSSVNNISGQSQVQQIISKPIQKSLPAQASDQPQRASDRVELSGVSHLLQALKSNDIRTDKVATIKAQIEAGTYDVDGKLDSVADKMLDDLSK